MDLIVQINISAFRSSRWEDAIKSWALSYRNAFAKHTPMIPLITVLPVADAPKTLVMYEEVSAGAPQSRFP